MPTYDYECDACGHTFELFQRITEDPIKKCPECKKNKARRLFGTGAAIMLKVLGSTKPTTAVIRTRKRPKQISQSRTPVRNQNQEKATPKNRAAPIQPLPKRVRAKEVQKAKSLRTDVRSTGFNRYLRLLCSFDSA